MVLQRANLRDGEDEEGGDDEQVVFTEYYSHMIRRYFASCSRHQNYFEQFCKIQNIPGAHTSPDPAGGSGCPPFPCVSDFYMRLEYREVEMKVLRMILDMMMDFDDRISFDFQNSKG